MLEKSKDSCGGHGGREDWNVERLCSIVAESLARCVPKEAVIELGVRLMIATARDFVNRSESLEKAFECLVEMKYVFTPFRGPDDILQVLERFDGVYFAARNFIPAGTSPMERVEKARSCNATCRCAEAFLAAVSFLDSLGVSPEQLEQLAGEQLLC